ncbi:MAG: thioredoxin family protein [Syntrophales bacterium]
MKRLQILGPGCAKCKKLAEDTEKAAKALGLEYEIEKITDIREMVKFGVLSTPALAVDGKVKSVGKILDAEKIKQLLSEE